MVNCIVEQLFPSFDSFTVLPMSAHTSNLWVPEVEGHSSRLGHDSASVAPEDKFPVDWFAGLMSHEPLSFTSILNLVLEEAPAEAVPEFLTVPEKEHISPDWEHPDTERFSVMRSGWPTE